MSNKKPFDKVLTVVKRKFDVGADTVCIELGDPDDWELPPFKMGAHMDLYLDNGLVRTYSLCGNPKNSTRYVFGIKKDHHSRGGSRFIYDELQVGDEVRVSLPRGQIDLSNKTDCIMIAGGIGITPFLSVLANQAQLTHPVNLVLHVFYRGHLCAFAEELTPYIAQGQVILHPTDKEPRKPLGDYLGAPNDTTLVTCCGPESMLDAFEAATKDWPATSVHIERFVAPKIEAPKGTVPYELILNKSKQSIQVPADTTVLQALRKLDVHVDSSCEGGICGACRIKWLEGNPIHQDLILTPEERKTDMMCCMARSAGDKLVVDL